MILEVGFKPRIPYLTLSMTCAPGCALAFHRHRLVNRVLVQNGTGLMSDDVAKKFTRDAVLFGKLIRLSTSVSRKSR